MTIHVKHCGHAWPFPTLKKKKLLLSLLLDGGAMMRPYNVDFLLNNMAPLYYHFVK